MKLVEFSVTNYRSITKKSSIHLSNLTVLVGKNNEGKSNLLAALNVAMRLIMQYKEVDTFSQLNRSYSVYQWDRDFPKQYQSRKSGLESKFRLLFRLEFRLEGEELNEFHKSTGIRGNEDIPIIVRVGKTNTVNIEVPKRGSSSYNRKSKNICSFISSHIKYSQISAIRTENMALDALNESICEALNTLNNNSEYKEACMKINTIEQTALDALSVQLTTPLRTFLPSLKKISIVKKYRPFINSFMENYDIRIDDGVNTSIRYKGDGVKNLITLALLNNNEKYTGASIVAIEEPESHLHPGAIHDLAQVIHEISSHKQVIITTHNPVFVEINHLESNIIVNKGTALPAKSINEIREVLGIYASDNLQSARYILLVEGISDVKIILKLLCSESTVINNKIENREMRIVPIHGASNLSSELTKYKGALCKCCVLVDNDQAAEGTLKKALSLKLLEPNMYKQVICRGQSESEIEDCINPALYKNIIEKAYNIKFGKAQNSRQKWSDRIKNIFENQGTKWNNKTEKDIKTIVADDVSNSTETNDKLLLLQKTDFLTGVKVMVESMFESEAVV